MEMQKFFVNKRNSVSFCVIDSQLYCAKLKQEVADKVRVLSVKQYPIDLTSKQSISDFLLQLKADLSQRTEVGICFAVDHKQTVLTQVDSSLSPADLQNFILQKVVKQTGIGADNWAVKASKIADSTSKKVRVYGIALNHQQCDFIRFTHSQVKLKRVESYFCSLAWLSWSQLKQKNNASAVSWALLCAMGQSWVVAVFEQECLIYQKTLNEHASNAIDVAGQITQLLTLLNVKQSIPILVLPSVFAKLTPAWPQDSKAYLRLITLPTSVLFNKTQFTKSGEVLSIAMALKLLELNN